MRIIFAIALAACVFILKPGIASAQTANVGDSLALVNLYDSTGGPLWGGSANWLTKKPLSTWVGITLDSTGRVTRIYLDGYYLTGSLPFSIGNFANLDTLILAGTNLSRGVIPPTIGNLTKLRYLDLSADSFSVIPPEIANLHNLLYLKLAYNQFTGTLPSFMGNFPLLQTLFINNNQLTGLPDSIGKLASLTWLEVSANQLASIPASIGNLSNLMYLFLGGNQLTSIPATTGNLGSLQDLQLDDNPFNGPIPDFLGNLTNLKYLFLDGCNFTGTIPASLANLANLTTLYMESNQLSGAIPDWIGNLTALTEIQISYNNFSDSLPSSFGNLSNLLNLDLSYNNISGIPASFQNLKTLQFVYFQHNQLGGNIPALLGSLTNLLILNLSHNNLSGNIPTELGNLHKINSLLLDSNKLSGPIPASLADFKYLKQFYLNNNKLTFDGMELLAKNYQAQMKTVPPIVVLAQQDTILPIHFINGKFSVSAGGTLSNNVYEWANVNILLDYTAITGDSTWRPDGQGNYRVDVLDHAVPELFFQSNIATINGYNDSSILPAKPAAKYASYEYTDTLGWTNYFYDPGTPKDLSDDTLLLSLKKNGQDIGTVGDGAFTLKLIATAGAGSNTGINLTSPLITNPTGYWVMNRYWQVNPTYEPSASVGVRFYYNNQDLSDVNGSYPTHDLTNNELIFYKAVGGNPDPTTNLAGATNIISILPGSYASDTTWTYHAISDSTQYGEYSVASFSGGGGGGTGNNGALPLTLLSFTGELAHGNALLNWQTAQEINTAYFNIQRSVDGLQFGNIGKTNAAGNSSVLQNYAYTDGLAGLVPLPPALYYRLQEVDKNGGIVYSRVIKLIPGQSDAEEVSIYPNPVHEALTVKLGNVTGQVAITIAGADGKRLLVKELSTTPGGNFITVNTSTLAAGIYILQVQYNGKTVVQKFVKQ